MQTVRRAVGHWQAGGWLKLLWIAGGERCDTLPTGRDGPKAGPGPPSTYTKRTQPFVRRSGLPSHTQRERETRRTRHAESAPAHSRVLTLTVSQAGEHRRLPGRQAGRQRQAEAGRQAGKQGSHGTLLRQRHCLPSARFGLARAAALVRLSRLRRPPRSVLVVLD